MMKKKISIEGMSCQHCVNHVKVALEDLEGVKSVEVDLESKSALVEFKSDLLDEDFKTAIEEVGYEVVGIDNL